MNIFIVVSHIFFTSIILCCLGLCINEVISDIRISILSRHDTNDTILSENDISDSIV